MKNESFEENIFLRSANLHPKKERDRFCLQKAIRHATGLEKPSGVELEASQEVIRCNRGAYGGFPVPLWGVYKMRRDLQAAASFAQGGAFVGTDVGDVIDLLRNSNVTGTMGATYLTDLTGTTQLPRITSGTSPQSVGEIAALQSSTLTVDGVTLTPKRVGVTIPYSKQLLQQSSPSISQLIANNLMADCGVKMDALALHGRGSNSEPLGVVNQPGIGSVAFGGAATHASLLSFEDAVATSNAEQPTSRIGWAVAPNVRKSWKAAAKVATYPKYLWDDNAATPGRGLVEGWPAMISNQLNSGEVIYGDWTKLIIGLFGGIDLIANPFSRAKEAVVEVTVNFFFDSALAHGQSFCVSSDSGAQ